MRDSSKLPETAVEQYEKEVETGLRKRAGQEGKLHLFVKMEMAIISAGEGCQLLFSLWSKSKKEFVSDEFMVAVTAQGYTNDMSLMDKLHTLFTDLHKADFESGLILVARIYRVGKLVPEAGTASSSGAYTQVGDAATHITDDATQIYKRHYGCCVLDLTAIKAHQMLIGDELNPDNVSIFQPKSGADTNFANLHEAIAMGRTDEYEVVPKTNGVVLGLVLFEGDVDQCLRKEARLKDVGVTSRRAMTGVDNTTARNDLYITLTGGEFSQDSKKSAKNIEVKIQCMMDTGAPVECLQRGSGVQNSPASCYR